MTVGIALIAKNEEENLPTLLKSIDGAFDRAVLLDTGSTDRTIEVFKEWAESQPKGFTYTVGKYEWRYDFGDARNAADGLLLYGDPAKFSSSLRPMVEWKCWADCDDEIVGAANIRSIVANVPDNVAYLFAGYQYAFHEGQCVCHLRRERLTRVGYGKWLGRVHEAQAIDAPVMQLPASELDYIHRKQMSGAAITSSSRNIEILEKWNADEPNNPRVVGYLGTEYATCGDHETAIKFFEQYHTLNSQWDEERAQMYRKWAQSLFNLNRPNEAMMLAFDAMQVLPSWSDNYLTLAEACAMAGEWAKAFEWAKRALELGAPDTMLIINPLDYTFLPLKIMNGCAAELGQDEQAVEIGQQALKLYPDESVRQVTFQAQKRLKRERTAQTFAMCAEQLIAHDEQLKALRLLEDCVPSFAMEHPRICNLRSFLHQRLAWIHDKADFSEHYETGGSKPEDFIADDKIDALCEYLPRTNFLLENLLETSN